MQGRVAVKKEVFTRVRVSYRGDRGCLCVSIVMHVLTIIVVVVALVGIAASVVVMTSTIVVVVCGRIVVVVTVGSSLPVVHVGVAVAPIMALVPRQRARIVVLNAVAVISVVVST